MVIQKITWWLWNQMFQYAYIKALSLRNKIPFLLDINWITYYYKFWGERPFQLGDIFDIDRQYADIKDIPFYERTRKLFWGKSLWRFPYSCQIVLKIIFSKLNWNDFRFYNHPLLFDEKFLHIENWYISWNFICEKYFKDCWDKIKLDFTFIKEPSPKTRALMNLMKEWSVSIHIRRGDYLKYPNIYPELWRIYYKTAIDIIKHKVKSPLFFVFSDDIDYVRKHFSWLWDAIFVDHNNGNNSWEDMLLMSSCKHNITAHSTFSWWWAYLNKNPKKIVITPKKWFKDYSIYANNNIIPDDWLTLPIN